MHKQIEAECTETKPDSSDSSGRRTLPDGEVGPSYPAGVGNLGFKLALWVHVLSAVAGYGSLVLEGVYVSQTRRARGSEAHAVAQAHYAASGKVAEGFLYIVPIFGILAVLLSDGRFSFAQGWISASFVVYLATLGVLHGVTKPARKASLVLFGELAGVAGRETDVTNIRSQLTRLGKRQALGAMVFNLLTALALFVMVFQPGR